MNCFKTPTFVIKISSIELPVKKYRIQLQSPDLNAQRLRTPYIVKEKQLNAKNLFRWFQFLCFYNFYVSYKTVCFRPKFLSPGVQIIGLIMSIFGIFLLFYDDSIFSLQTMTTVWRLITLLTTMVIGLFEVIDACLGKTKIK